MKAQERKNVPIFLRVHTNVRRREKVAHRRAKWARYALAIDTETTIDTKQSLTFGFYRFCELQADGNYACQEEGIFYPDKCDKDSLGRLHKYVRSIHAETLDGCPEQVRCYSRSKFVEEVLWRACEARAVIVGCNLAFDLSRLAVEYRTARRRNTGWSLLLFQYYNKKNHKWLPNTFRPRIRINPKDSRDAFISLAGGERPFTRGRFLNLLTLAWALRNERHSLKSACKEWHVKGKLDHRPTGRVTRKEIEYCRQDVRATVSLLNAMKAEYDKYPVGLQPESAFSAASIAKAYLESMGLREPARKYSVPDKIHGIAMQGYYGGRSEIRIRHTTVPVVYCDFTSEYPTVNALLGIWPQFIAKDLKARNWTKQARNLLRRINLSELFQRDTWPQLAFFARIEPKGDILPVRTLYSDSGDTNIGLNPLTSRAPIWFAGPDLAASKLLTGRTPHIEGAIRFVPQGIQRGLKSTVIGDRTIDPLRDNFFTAVIETRKGFPSKHPMNYFLKILANAGGYGMYAELNRKDFGKNSHKRIRVYSGEDHRSPTVPSIEIPGPWYFPPVASLITAGGRLLLAMLEKAVTNARGTYMMCDTDSMAIVSTRQGGVVPCAGGRLRLPNGSEAVKALPWHTVEQIATKFIRLNPYDRESVPDILKIEDYNFDRKGKPQQRYGFAISAKRYVIVSKDGEIIKPSEHGLGPYFHPNRRRYRPPNCQNIKDRYPQWIVNGWRWILRNRRRDKAQMPRWFRMPTMRKIAITTPNVLARLRVIDREDAKPYNFVLSPVLIFEGPTLIAPFCDQPSQWIGLRKGLEYTSIEDGKRFRICRPQEEELLIGTSDPVQHGNSKGGMHYLLSTQLRDFDQVFREYFRHPEFKSLAPDGSPCVADTHGLLRRRPIEAIMPFNLMGKEVDRHKQDDVNVLSDIRPLQYEQSGGSSGILDPISIRRLQAQPRRHVMRITGLSQHAIERALRGERIQARTLLKLLKMARTL